MKIPDELRNRILRVYGAVACDWLSRLDEVYSACVDRWRLTDCVLTKSPTVSLVSFAESPDYGQVVLKIGYPHPELHAQMEALSIFGGRIVCKCHESDEQLGALLMERIIPGAELTSVSEPLRTDVAANVIADLPVPPPMSHSLPTYGEWIERAFSRARRENLVGERMLRLIREAEKILERILDSDNSRMVLHGDLHHENILRSGEDSWRAIDPKGVIGPRCMEAARYITNEMEYVGPRKRRRSLDRTTSVIGERLGQPATLIAACAFVDHVLGTCWSFEDGDPPDDLRVKIDDCAYLFDYAQGAAL